MGSETLVNGHAFDFDTSTCAKCGMQEVEYEKRGEPQCTGKKPEAAESARKHIEYTWPDE